jgi:hypothetical protein
MDELGLFTAALGLSGPWRVIRTEFDAEAAQLDLYLGFERVGFQKLACTADLGVGAPGRQSMIEPCRCVCSTWSSCSF